MTQAFSYEKLTIHEASGLLRRKEASAEQLARKSIERAKELEPKLNAFVTIAEQSAMAQALAADQYLLQEETEEVPLTGIPYAAKDIFCTKGIETTCASKILKGYIPPYNATAIERLERHRSVLIGKNNCDEFAMGTSNENSAYGPVRNPWNAERVAGGSTGGGAAAVAAGSVLFAIGTDTGGSLRLPASFCGIVGLKVTYGRVSRYGVAALASSLDTIGPLTKDVADAALVLEALAGHDPNDATTPKLPDEAYFQQLNLELKGKNIAIWKEWNKLPGIEDDVKASFEEAVEVLRKQGATITEISLPHAEYAVPVYYIITPSEASSNMARYDGIRYGASTTNGEDLLSRYIFTRAEGFGPEVKRRILLGTYVLSAGYYDAYYKKAQRVRTLIKREFEQAFAGGIDAIICPTSSTEAFALGEREHDPLAMYAADIFTAPVNIAGIPAISVPCGFSKNNLPLGLQIIGRSFGEQRILDIASAYERATEWHKRHPSFSSEAS